MASKLKPTPPAFEAKGKKSEKPRDLSEPSAPKRGRKAATKPPAAPEPARPVVTAGPFYDPQAPAYGGPWTVITRAGDMFTYHRFKAQEDAQAFAQPATPTR